MSAYGSIGAPKPIAPLEITVYPVKTGCISLHPISAAEAPDELVSYLHGVFNQELEEGRTYPQEGPLDRDGFAAYFFVTASTTVIGVLHGQELSAPPKSLDEARAGRSWEECVGGVFYIKPNYPGRASHNCNGGFLIPHAQRGHGASHALAKGFTDYAPKLGYRQSVFNLVFANNFALKVWETNGFQRVGTIPGAGRLRTGPDGADEYVDAHILYKSFV